MTGQKRCNAIARSIPFRAQHFVVCAAVYFGRNALLWMQRSDLGTALSFSFFIKIHAAAMRDKIDGPKDEKCSAKDMASCVP